MTLFITAVTFLFPVIMLPINLCLFTVQRRHGTLYSFLIALGMAAIAFNFAPFDYQNTDILRHFERLRSIKNVSFQQALVNDAYSSLMGYYLILKVFSMVENPSLLPAFITFLGYFVCLYVISKMDRGKNSATRFITLFLFMSCTSFLGFCSGIRQYTAFALFVLFFYLEAVQKKYRLFAWIMYFLLITLHTSIAIVIVLRIIAEFFNKTKNIYIISPILLFWGMFQTTILNFLNNYFSGNVYVDKILELAGYYEENSSKVIVPTFIWRFFLLMLCIVVVITLIRKSKKADLNVPRKYLCFALSVCVFALGSVSSYDIFGRFSTLAFMLIIPLAPEFFKRVSREWKEIDALVILLFSCLVLLYNMSQYLTFHFNSIEDILSTNIFSFIGGV